MSLATEIPEDMSDVQALAAEALKTMSLSYGTHSSFSRGIGGAISVWRSPSISGPWSGIPAIGASERIGRHLRLVGVA